MADLTLTQEERNKLDQMLQVLRGNVPSVPDTTQAQPLELPAFDYTDRVETPEPAPVFSAGTTMGLSGPDPIKLTEDEKRDVWERIG